MELIEPGQVPINLWRPELASTDSLKPVYGSYATVGRRP
jgi:hypothetical protein